MKANTRVRKKAEVDRIDIPGPDYTSYMGSPPTWKGQISILRMREASERSTPGTEGTRSAL